MKHNLPGWALKILRALTEVVMPRGETFDMDLTDHVLEFIDRYVGFFPIHLKIGFPLGLLLLEFGPLIFMRRFKRFSKMSLDEREEYVKGWIDSKMALRRDLLKGVKGLVMVAFYSHPKAMEHIGYDIENHVAATMARGY
jgi:hypothetical protein